MTLEEVIQTGLVSSIAPVLITLFLFKKTEAYKSSLIRENNTHNVKFKSYYELQLKFLSEIYSLMVISKESILQFTSVGQGPEWKDLGTLKEVEAYKDLRNVIIYFEKGEILIDETLSNEIKVFLDLNNKSFHKMWAAKGLANNIDNELIMEAREMWHDLQTDYPKESKKVLYFVRYKFKEIIAAEKTTLA